ncbi:MAG: hypothetical protein RQ745_09125 [Longimicrobiales bacterium]|nr:hypothetical protein [Longimicrobiales bacterium]
MLIRPTSLHVPLFAALLFLSISPFAGPASAQETGCALGVIERIVVNNASVIEEEDIPDGFVGWGMGVANNLHLRTRKEFILDELLIEEGDCYDPFLVDDSERVLRRHNFIDAVDLTSEEIAEGRWAVLVATRDDWSTRLEITAQVDNGVDLRRAALAETNVFGRGMTARVFLVQNDAERQIGFTFFTPRVLGTRTNFTTNIGTTRIGDLRTFTFSYPFVGEVGKWAWEADAFELEDFFSYSVGVPGNVAWVLLPNRDRSLSFTLARRFGTPGDLGILGFNLAREDLDFPELSGEVDFVDGGDFDSRDPASDSLVDVIRPQTRLGSATRLSILLGQRNIDFVQRRQLDALSGVQDVEVGTDVAFTLGHTVSSGFDSGDSKDLFFRLRMYGGAAPGDWVIVTDASIQGRQLFDQPGSDLEGFRDVLGEFDLLTYWQPSGLENHTFFTRVAAAGGWSVDLPWQLTLGGAQGVRGFDDADLPGGRRAVFSMEDRIAFDGPFSQVIDFGATIFGDAGRIWEGDAPFGIDSGWRGAVGAGLRVGFPKGTRGVVRIDLAHAVGRESSANGVILRITALDLLGLTGGLRDRQVLRSLRIGTGADRFAPPR